MPLPAFLAPLLTSLISAVVVKFVVFAGVFALVGFLVPKVVGLLGPYVGTGTLTSAFNGLGPGVWFFLDFFALGYGVPLVLSAFIARFLIRRLPVIG